MIEILKINLELHLRFNPIQLISLGEKKNIPKGVKGNRIIGCERMEARS